MKHIRKVLLCLIILEFFNLTIGYLKNGMEIFLPYSGFNDPPQYFDIDSIYGVTRIKNSKQMASYPWGSNIHKVNSMGFRDDEFNENGILVIGNSFVEGYGLDNKDRFTDILEKRLNVNINNAGSGAVWTPIQGLILLKSLLKVEKLNFNKIVFIITPGEIANIGNRSPENDTHRNYPYKKNDSIAFHISKENTFNNNLTLTDKVKRFSKNLFVFKVYNTLKYYGSSRTSKRSINFNKKNLDWLLNKIEEEDFNHKIDIVLINNLGRKSVNHIYEEFKNKNLENITLNIIEFPDELSNYFISNGHLNKKGNLVLANLLEQFFKNY